MAASTAGPLRSVLELPSAALAGPNAAALRRIFHVDAQPAACVVGPALAAKYAVPQDNQQLVLSLSNRWTLEQTWFNRARTQKPQSFTKAEDEFADPTGGGARCDFCRWQELTATDEGFGRVELPAAVTGSNLFKIAHPSHGLVLFRHHDPLAFDLPQLADLLDASWMWFEASHSLHPGAAEPFLLWNALPRAGASQYHGHAQTMLTEAPVPGVARLRQAAAAYEAEHAGYCYYSDLLKAHAAVGLLRQLSIPAAGPAAGGAAQRQHVAWAAASLVPYKDMEVTVMGTHLCCPAFQQLLHAALRCLIDRLGCRTFNVGVLGLDLSAPPPAGVGLDRQHAPSSSRGGAGASSNGDGASTSSGSSGGSGSGSGSGSCANGAPGCLPGSDHWALRPPVIARVVSRGKATSVASDFGALEVFGGASIGHTDPFTVAAQLDAQLACCLASGATLSSVF